MLNAIPVRSPENGSSLKAIIKNTIEKKKKKPRRTSFQPALEINISRTGFLRRQFGASVDFFYLLNLMSRIMFGSAKFCFQFR